MTTKWQYESQLKYKRRDDFQILDIPIHEARRPPS
jgi:hypothetical protein